MNDLCSLIIVGGGAAGIFAAIHCAENNPSKKVLVLEQSQKLLSKVKVSGGGRCNVTHSCFDPQQLVQNYPRGGKELRGPFSRFQPRDMVDWLDSRGVALKTEADGRMFPTTDDSQTIIDCLLDAAKKAGVTIQCGSKVVKISKEDTLFSVQLSKGETIQAEKLMLATGSGRFGYELAKELGHTIIEPVPSLFTFNVPDSHLISLAGVSVEDAQVTLPNKMSQRGPILITHWGFSGPAVLKLSAWAARELYALSYETPFNIDWCPGQSYEQLRTLLKNKKSQKSLLNDPLVSLPKKLWNALLLIWKIEGTKRWNHLSKHEHECLIKGFKQSEFVMSGKTTYKQEFVTCGGVKLSEVNFKTMESKIVPNLYFAGEILDIDGVTGGFNFQAAWTGGWIVALSIYELSHD